VVKVSAPTIARRTLVLGALIAVAGASSANTEPTVRVLTEEYPPYNFTQDGKLTGLSTEVVQAVIKEVQKDVPLKSSFTSMPWARAYDLAQLEENVAIYSMNRAKHREQLFKWVGVVAPSDYYLYALKRRKLQLRKLDDAQSLQIGTVNQAIGEQYLAQRGFTLGRNLQSSAKYEQGYDKLKLGRIDLWIINEMGASQIARQAGDDPDELLEKVLFLPEVSAGNYLAFSLSTPDALVERFRKALETIKKNGTYDAIQKKWR
jgi:polar amino acid transport system substrate-binding protein